MLLLYRFVGERVRLPFLASSALLCCTLIYKTSKSGEFYTKDGQTLKSSFGPS